MPRPGHFYCLKGYAKFLRFSDNPSDIPASWRSVWLPRWAIQIGLIDGGEECGERLLRVLQPRIDQLSVNFIGVLNFFG